MKLKEAIDIRYPVGGRIVFRLLKGRSPMTPVSALYCKEEGIVLVECMYLKSGSRKIYSGNKEVVPLKFENLEDDDEYYSHADKQQVKYMLWELNPDNTGFYKG